MAERGRTAGQAGARGESPSGGRGRSRIVAAGAGVVLAGAALAFLIWRPGGRLEVGAGLGSGSLGAGRGAGEVSPVDAEAAAWKAEAMAIAQQLVRSFPEVPDAWLLLGLVHGRHGNRAEAINCWRKCLEINPGYAMAYYCLGDDALKCGELARSEELLRKAIQLDPDGTDAHLLLAQALMALGRLEEGIDMLKRNLQIFPESRESYFRLGNAYLHLKDYAQAKAAYLAAIDVDPNCTSAYYGLSMVCARTGQSEEAARYRERFRELKSRDRKLDSAHERVRDDRAVVLAGVVRACVVAGNVYQATGDLARATEYWSRAAELDPKDTESRSLLVMAYQEEGRREEARRVLEELIEIEPDNPLYRQAYAAISGGE